MSDKQYLISPKTSKDFDQPEHMYSLSPGSFVG